MLAFALITFSLVGIGFTLWPLVVGSRRPVAASREDTPLGRLLLQKDLLLTNLTDLDFEHSMGKLAEDDYQRLRSSLKRQTGHVLEQIETIGVDEPEPESVAAFCAQCGGALPTRARFCPGCGEPVS